MNVGEKISVMKEWLNLGTSVFETVQQVEQHEANGNAGQVLISIQRADVFLLILCIFIPHRNIKHNL